MALPGVLLIEPRLFADQRGYFFESWSSERYKNVGVPPRFVQDNVSASTKGVLRGLHLQHPNGQGKLVTALEGSIYDVAVDLRYGSDHFGQWCAAELNGERGTQMYIPPGFAHGFFVLSARALISYKCTAPYTPDDEVGIRWDDPDLGIDWPTDGPHLSAKDATLPPLANIARERLPGI